MLSHKKAALQKFSVARAPCFIVVVVGHEKIGEQQMDKNFASKASASFTESSLVFAKDVEPYLMHFFVKPRLSSLQYDPPPLPLIVLYTFFPLLLSLALRKNARLPLTYCLAMDQLYPTSRYTTFPSFTTMYSDISRCHM